MPYALCSLLYAGVTMSLIDKLKAGVKNIKATVWPGTDYKIGIRILTEAEVQAAHFAVEQLFKKQGIDFTAATVDAYQSEQNTQVLARAIVDPDTRSPLFKNADELREQIAHPEIKAALTTEYNDWQAECSPALSEMTEERYAELFEDVKKNGPSTLSGSNLRTLKGLITYLADRQLKLRKVSGYTSP